MGPPFQGRHTGCEAVECLSVSLSVFLSVCTHRGDTDA